MDFEPIPIDAWPPAAFPGGQIPAPRNYTDRTEITVMPDVIIGTSPSGRRQMLRIVLREIHGQRTTVTHEPYTDRGFELVFLAPGRNALADVREAAAANPVNVSVGLVVTGLTVLWQRWNRNASRPGCVHLDNAPPDMPIDDKLALRCPQTGFKWGSEFLVEPLPSGVLKTVFESVDTLHTIYQEGH